MSTGIDVPPTTDDSIRGLIGAVVPLHQLISSAKSALDALESQWVRVHISEFGPLESTEHRRVVIHPIELAMGRSKFEVAPQWEGRVWRNDLPRLQAFIQRASDDGVEFDALVRVDVNSRVGLVLVIEGARI